MFELIIRNVVTGALVLVFRLPAAEIGPILSRMHPPTATTRGGAKAARSPDEIESTDAGPVAGRIETAQSEIARAIDGYMAYKGDRVRGSSVKVYRGLLGRAAAELGWVRVSDITADDVEAWTRSKRTKDKHGRCAWCAQTSNRNLGILQDFTRWVKKQAKRRGVAVDDPLEDLEGVPDRDRKQRGRASTTDEARAFIAWTVSREQTDGRADGFRALMRACVFMQGLRPGEPEVLCWRHLRLDEPIPFIHWTPEVQKNHREELTALNPELVPLLRAHRERMIERAKADGGVAVTVDRRFGRQALRPYDPANPDALVFPKVSSGCQWNKDRDKAGIAKADALGRRWEGRAARRWFSTTLRAAGANDLVVRSLLRHKVEVSERYFDVDVPTQVEVFSLLPKLWPGNYLCSAETPDSARDAKKVRPVCLTGRGKDPKVVVSLGDSTDQSGSPNAEVLRDPERRAERPSSCGCGTRGAIDAGPQPRVPQVGSRGLDHQLALLRLERADSIDAMIDLMDAVLRLLKGARRGHSKRTTDRGGAGGD